MTAFAAFAAFVIDCQDSGSRIWHPAACVWGTLGDLEGAEADGVHCLRNVNLKPIL